MKRVIGGIIVLTLVALSFGCGAPAGVNWSKVEILGVVEFESIEGVTMAVTYQYALHPPRTAFINKENWSEEAMKEAIAASIQEVQEAEQKLKEAEELLR